METIYGWAGRLLRVDLTTRTARTEEIPQKILTGYIGGRGFTARYLYDEVSPGTDPLGPENRIVFAVGPLTGTRMPSSGRYVVGTYSPLSLTYTRSVSGGAWGAMLKYAGYDLLIIEGAGREWSYLSITDQGVEFKEASSLLGLTTSQTEEAIQEELGNPRVRSAVIGPAGENLVRAACIQTERRSAGRGGVGCVMGAKKLKGVAVFGRKKPELFDPEGFNGLMKTHLKINSQCQYYDHFHKLGTTAGVPTYYDLGVHPVKNFRQNTFEGIDNLLPPAINELGWKTGETGCWNCYMRCGSLFQVPGGPFKGRGYENPEYETMWSFGANCLNSDFAGVLAANAVCDELGVDTISTGSGVAFLMECHERGLIDSKDLNGVELKWGDARAMVAVAEQIATRSSRAGDLIAEGGVRHAARVIGQGSERFAMQAKGLELAAYDPRGIQAHGLGYATSNIGGSHQIGYSVQELFGFPERVDRFSARDKGRHTIWSQRFITIFDTAVACGFPNAFTESQLNFETYLTWLSKATGRTEEFSGVEALEAIFDRIYTLERAFNLRMGLTRADDDLPARLKEEPIPDGPSAGHVWHREELLRDYYRARGWAENSGVPTRITLASLGLSEVADDIQAP